MGNTSSHSSTSSSPHPGTAQATTSSASAPHPTGTSTNSSIPGTFTGSTSGLHSGLTPPLPPPSPPPPSTPPLLPYAGHLSPQNPHALSHPQAHDYSKSTVTQLILDNRLAPFYRGLEDYEEDWTEDDIGRVLTEMREKDYEEGVENSYTHRLREERDGGSGMGSVAKKMGVHRGKESRKVEMKEERERRERKAYKDAVECPICFLNYPPNINTSRCCQQPVCTECFVQIKRTEATVTHLESEAACCPYCVETDFGVIYERPLEPIAADLHSALSTSPEAGTSTFSALSLGSEAELGVGPGMAPKVQESVRRKSVSSKSKEVVTIDQIRPDWENKLNAVKAAAARRASRRIVMRQVGDRLIPIGFTSSRATGTADFSMSLPAAQAAEDSSGSRRSRRRDSARERDLEELMIMEAMRLSMIDHEEHQRKTAEEERRASTTASSPLNPNAGESSRSSANSGNGPIITTTPYSTLHSGPSSSSTTNLNSSSTSAASKLLSKFGNRNRSSSDARNRNNGSPRDGSRRGSVDHRVSFAPSTPIENSNHSQPGTGSSTSSLQATPTSSNDGTGSHTIAITPLNRTPPSSFSPTAASISAPSTSTSVAMSNASPTSTGPLSSNATPLPRLSLDMAPLTPSAPKAATGNPEQRVPLNRMDTVESGFGDEPEDPTNYAQLESDEE